MKVDIYYDIVRMTTVVELLQNIRFDYFGQQIIIPQYFISDGCSIPRFLWSLVAPQIDGRTLQQSVQHDYLFQEHKGFFKSNWFYFKKLKNHLSLPKRVIILTGLTLFGIFHYK